MATAFQFTPMESYMDMLSQYSEPVADPFPDVPAHLRCRYTSKPCGNLRTSKRGGGLHRFCEFHRARANENQWRVDHRRRLQRIQEGRSRNGSRARSPRRTIDELPLLMPTPIEDPLTWYGEHVPFETDDHTVRVLTTEELYILQCLLFSDEESDATAFSP